MIHFVSPKLAPGWLVLLALPFLGVGLLAIGIFGRQSLDQGRARGWQRVPAKIEYVKLDEKRTDGGGVVYLVTWRYAYEYDDRTYTGAGGVGSSDPRHREQYRILEDCRQSGKPFLAWVNPANPQESMLFPETTSIPWALLPFGVCFAGAGVFLMISAIRGALAKRRRARLLTEHPGRHWRADDRWRKGFTFDSRAGVMLAGQGMAVAFLAIFMSMFVFLVLTQGAPIWAQGIVALFTALTLLMLGNFVYRALRFFKYGSPRLAMLEMPAVPGRMLVAVVLCRRHVEAENVFKATLKCQQTTGAGKHSRIETLHENAIEVPHDRDLARERGGTAIPIKMPIPPQLPDTTKPSDDPEVTWRLTVQAATPGVNFKAEFYLPVFRVENESLIEKRPESKGAAT